MSQISQLCATDLRMFKCFKLIFQCNVIPVNNLKHSILLLTHPLNSKVLCKHVNLHILPNCCKSIIPFGNIYMCIPGIYFLLRGILNATLIRMNVTFTHSCALVTDYKEITFHSVLLCFYISLKFSIFG